MSKLIILTVLFLTTATIRSQIKPEDKGFQHYRIKQKNDTIDFYIYNPGKIKKKHLFLHIDGSLPAPLWIETSPCCVTLDPFNYNLIPEDYAYVVISKHGFPFSAPEDFPIPDKFWQKNTLEFRVKRVNEVIKHIRRELFKPEKIVVVGTSQGTDVGAKLATINKHITHLGFWAGGGHTQLMEFIMFIRKDAVSGKITEEQAVEKTEALLKQFDEMFSNPVPDKMWEDNSYLSYVSFSEPPVENLLKLDIPVYVAAGTKDKNVAIENTYIIPVEFIRHRKKNLTFRQFPNYDHGFTEIETNGKETDRFDDVTKDFIEWLRKN